MKNENYFGAYGRFLDSDLAGQLQAHDMVMAVTWARKHATGRDELDSIHKLATQILERAVDHVDQPPVLELLAAALIERMRAYTDCDRITARLRASGDGPRRAVARTMFHHAVAENHGAFFVMDVCAIDPQDILWLLSEFLGVSDTGIRRVIAEVIARRLDGQDVETFNAVLVSSSEFTELRAAIEPLLAPVGLDSALAEEMKADHKRFMEYHQPKAATLAVPIAQSLSEALAKNASDVFFHVWLILHHQNRKTGDSAGPFPGWSHIDQDIRAQILRAARDFLRARPPVPSGAWWKEGTSTLGMSAGYGALHLLAAQSPDSLDQLADGDWNFWVKIVVTGGVGESKDSGRSVLVNKAYERAKETFLVTFEEIVEGENERHKQVFVIDRIGELWTGQLARMLRERITDSTLTPYSFKCVLAKLLSRSDDEAKILARRMATGFIAGEGEDRLKAVFATAELISHDPGEWGVVWPVVQANEAFGVEILQVVASEHEYSSFATTLDEGSVAAICIWISKLGLDKDREDPDYPGLITAPRALARLWNTLINFLTHKGTTGSCDAIRRLIEALPHHPGLQHCLREAEDRTRRATWIPLDPKDGSSLFHVGRHDRSSLPAIR